MHDGSAQKHITGDNAVKIASSIETAIRNGSLESGRPLPTVRSLADRLAVSPATVSAAYRQLRTRGLIIADGRRGTRVSPHLRPLSRRPSSPAPSNIANLADGNPDPALLPTMALALASIDSSSRLYGESPHHDGLVQLMRRELADAPVPGIATAPMSVVSGAMEAIDRMAAEQLLPGDRVAVEDPGFTGILDLLVSRGLSLLPVAIDEHGMIPRALHDAMRDGAKAMIITPRVQSPTGAALSAERARELRQVLRDNPQLLIIQDDHARLITEAPLHCLHDPQRSRWTYIQSFSKALNPDLRLAVVTGDDETMSRINRRMLVTERWVSHILQRTALALLSDSAVRRRLEHATNEYARRRRALLAELKKRRINAVATSGYNIWTPVREETATVQGLATHGYAVSPGERYRLHAPLGIRITASRLLPEDAGPFAAALAAVLSPDGPAAV